MTGYVYNTETMTVVDTIEGSSNEEIEAIANNAWDTTDGTYGLTYSPAFGAVDGL